MSNYPILHDGCRAPRCFHLQAPDDWYQGREAMTWGLMHAIGSPIACVWEYEDRFVIEYKQAAGGRRLKVTREAYMAEAAAEAKGNADVSGKAL